MLAAAGVYFAGVSFFPPACLFLLFGMFLFYFRVMGAGDGKLMALIGGYLGWQRGLYAVGIGFLIGALWSVWKLKKSGIWKERFCYLYQYVIRLMHTGTVEPYDTLEDAGASHHIPFAVCLSMGVWLYLAIEILLHLEAG